ncbi:hypothetical protein MJO10_32790, partial [Salmonella enterica subsp. enterica serovar Anatum]|nr:hypothetical protein [Salmonella enterica subsp. enterica serovar Anatum]
IVDGGDVTEIARTIRGNKGQGVRTWGKTSVTVPDKYGNPHIINIKLAIQVYYTQYVLNDIHLLSWMGFFSMGCILIGVLLVPAA